MDPVLGGVEIGYHNRSASRDPIPVFAAQDGIVVYAATSARGPVLCLDHTDGWSTEYAELEHLLPRPTDRFSRRRKEKVRAGDIIGHAKRSMLRIRFSLSRLASSGSAAEDPAAWIPAWEMLPWFDGGDSIPSVTSELSSSVC
jgi:hypothetical protein